MIIKTSKLNKLQIEQIVALENRAFEKDGLDNHSYLSNNLNLHQDMPCFFLGYEGDKLAAFLTLFAPDKGQAEILAATDPQYQRRGWFSQLYTEALDVIKAFDIDYVLFAVEQKSCSGNAVISRFEHICLDRTEYRMELQKGTGNIEQIALQGMSERVTQENKDLFGDISASISEQREDEAYLDLIASSEKRRGYLYLWEGKYVGTYVIGTEENGTFIYGVGIRKEYQGKGISRYMMKQAVMCAFNETNRVFLEVDSHNPAALNLYRHCGFQTIFQVDYDRIAVE